MPTPHLASSTATNAPRRSKADAEHGLVLENGRLKNARAAQGQLRLDIREVDVGRLATAPA